MAKRSFARARVVGKKRNFFILCIILILAILLTIFGWKTPFTGADGRQIEIKGAKTMRYGIDIRGGVEAVYAPRDYKGKVSEDQINSAARILQFRLDQLQILDSEVTASPTNGRIIVRFPWRADEKVFNPEKALRELGEMAYLSFREENNHLVIDGSQVQSAQAVFNSQTNSPEVSLTLKPEGREAFAEATKRLKGTGKTIRIQLDDKIISAPTVNAAITDGNAVISGHFTRDEAISLAQRINGGALPFAMQAISSSTISPSLGRNSLHVMTQAGLIAFILICVFMLFMYRLPGFVACLSLTAQLVGILLAISIPQQTLTLQGIAGIILSIGMGVDANIIISERIREEANSGAALPTFLYNGFTRAFSAVMDSNVTVAIAAIVLMVFGSGTVLSFGYSLLVGVILNGICGVWMTRKLTASLSAFKFLQNPRFYGRTTRCMKLANSFAEKPAAERDALEEEKAITLRNRSFLRRSMVDFYKWRFAFFTLSAVLIVGGLIYSFVRGIDLDIQFKGGSLIEYSYTGEIKEEECDRLIEEAIKQQVKCQINRSIADQSTRLVVSVAGNEALPPDKLENMSKALQTKFPDQHFEVASSQLVSPTIGREMLQRGLLALLIASVLIIGYVWFSFRSMSGPSAGVTALIALLHDILLAALAFIIMGSLINETLIAVILTILGFSINDTIVIYDRIRENKRLYGSRMNLADLVTLSINQSLRRSVYTSLCIFIAVMIALVFAIAYDIGSIREFALPMMVGAIVGTFSSVVIASPLWVMWKMRHGKTGLEE